MSSIYEIHPANLETLMADLEAMKRRARKLDCDPIVVEVLGEKMIEVSKLMPGGRVVKFQSPRTLVRVTGNVPKLEGWSLVAKIEYLGDERLIRCVPGEECPEEFRTRGIECDHCGYQRHRKEVFVLRHEDGRHVQVGRNCIADFLGGKSPEALLAAAEYLLQAETAFSECDGCGGHGETAVDVEEYLTGVAISIRRLGWLSRKAVRLDETSTATDAWYLVKPDLRTEKDRTDWEKWVEKHNLHYQERDQEQARDALAWAQSQPTMGTSDYLYNLGVTCRAGYVTFKTRGIVASAIQAYLKHLEKDEEINRRKFDTRVRGHVGTLKKREVFTKLTVKKMRYFDGFYGSTTMVIFEDETGNILKWFASKDLDELEEGDIVDLKATVKEHGECKGTPETVINRGVVEKKYAQLAV